MKRFAMQSRRGFSDRGAGQGQGRVRIQFFSDHY
jgi:hypothetical protein